jgi:PKD repeat protein
MPLEPQFRKPFSAQYTFSVVDRYRRIVAFKDASEGHATAWKWDFGDGTTSTEQDPIHQYKERPDRPGIYTVILTVTDATGATSRMSKVWDVHVQ